MKYNTGYPRTHVKHVDLYRSLLIGAASVQKRRIGPSIFLRILRGRIPVGGVSIRVQLHFVPRRRSAGAHHTFLSIPPGITLGQRGERSTSSKWRERGGAHCRPGVRDTRVPRALTASLSLLEPTVNFTVRPIVRGTERY